MPTPPEIAQASAVYWVTSVRFTNGVVLSAYTTLYYDYLLTLFDEIELFWKSANISILSVLFVVNRYLGLLGPIAIAFEYFGDFSEKLQTYHQAYAIALQGIVAVMLVIRTYALYNRSKRILVILVVTHVAGALMCLVTIVTNINPVHTSTPLPFKHSACDLSLTDDQAVHLAIAWGAMLWFDTTIFVLTLVQALRMRRHFPGGLLEVMFRDGTVYYAFMMATVVANIVMFLITRTASPLKGLDTTLANVLSTTLTSRLMLNIRDPDLQKVRIAKADTFTSVWTETPTTPTSFRTVTLDYSSAEDVEPPPETRTSRDAGV
ncbi:hypothetical protein C8Q77DRAFT_1154726 [Trametes polyzona]|nr:hypothetical protein C8Q77DRAFT_1154726 [Trametes polyzona]